MIEWQLYPKSDKITADLQSVVDIFENRHAEFSSTDLNDLKSNEVLKIVEKDLENIGFKIEKSKRGEDKIKVPVLWGRNGALEKSFDADGVNLETRTVIEVEAGRGVTNNQFLKDLFQACMMPHIDNLIICVRILYSGRSGFDEVIKFFDTMYASGRLKLPLSKILIIGY